MHSLSDCWVCLRNKTCIESCSLHFELRFAFFGSLVASSKLLAMMTTVLMMMKTMAATFKSKMRYM